MFKKINIFIIIILLITLTGCNLNKTTLVGSLNMNEELVNSARIIQDTGESNILVDSTYYSIDKAVIGTTSGKKISSKDLQPGSLINLKTTGVIMTSFPGQGEATRVILYDDKRSQEISEAVRYILEHQPNGKIISPSLQKITDDKLIIHFFEWTINGKKYEATLNLKNKDLKVIEIKNEFAEKLKEQQEKALKDKKDFMYTGYITKVLPNGLRINRVDFTFDKSITFKNQKGETLKLENFQVGDFVTAYHSHTSTETFPFKGTLYQLEQLMNNTPSTDWIKSLTESGQFIEPVIMDFWQEKDGTKTVKIIDIKKTKKFLYIVNYNHKTGKQTVKEIPNK
ncbi:hypothetical protein M3172_03935 [Mesobacillus subterraneus]|uniref:hypothetical protein n=1 Tax=Mesobacillus subterraneus TaxID=285983 RepID=UPI00203DFB01|nr:hypothetical protein [Mesobacillus subterraneus]MCM3572326.1 hypothetical protein [Mesobacillus subterraneus]